MLGYRPLTAKEQIIEEAFYLSWLVRSQHSHSCGSFAPVAVVTLSA